jgi:hypothetical protein
MVIGDWYVTKTSWANHRSPVFSSADKQFVPLSHTLSPDFSSSQRTRWVLLITLCLISALVGRFCYLARPLDHDAAMFIYMGKMVSEGGRLCHDLIDNKFPTVGLMFTVLWKTLGTSWPAYIALQTALSLWGAWMLGRMAARHVGQHAQLPTMLFTIVYLNFTTAVFGGFQLETIQAFFAILAARSALIAMESDNPADAFVTGLCAGCGAMFKPTGLAVLIAMTAGLWVRHRRARLGIRIIPHLLAAAAGVAIPAGVALAYLMGADMLGDMPGLWRQISTYASQTALTWGDLTKPLVAATFLGFPIFVRGWVCRRQRDPNAVWPLPYVTTFAIFWLLAETAGVVMQRRMYAYHFLPIIPPAALVFGLFPRANRPIPLAAALLPMALLSIYAAGDVMAMTYTGQEQMPESQYLALHAKPGDAVWIDSWPRLVLETNLRPGSRYPMTFLFANYDTAGLDYANGMIADFERIKPAYIFLPAPMDRQIQGQLDFVAELMRRPVRRQNYAAGWHRIEAYTQAHYTKESMVGSETVYRRRAPTDAVAGVKEIEN